MEQNTQPKFGKHIPSYLQAELLEMHQKKQQTAPSDDVQPQPNAEEQIPPQADTTPSPTEPQNEEEQTVPHSAPSQDEGRNKSDVEAWKGRLKKEQAERQQLNARLIEEAEARERAEARVRELEAQQHQPVNPPVATTQSDPNGLSDAELEELKLFNPDLYLKVKKAQTTANAQSSVTNPQGTDTPPTVTPAQTQIAQPSLSERDRIWYAEVQREIPEIQGLLGDSKFVEFAQGKTDWTGKSGLDLIQVAGQGKDVRLIPAIRNLVDEYKQAQVSPPSTVTVAPQKSATVKAKANTPKEMTEKDEAHAEMLARQGKTAELRQFLAKFK